MNEARRVEKLRADHSIESFDCSREELNRYLLRYAWQNQQAGAAQTYVGLVGDAVIGDYTLAVGNVMREEVPERLTKGLAHHPVPIMVLARLAVDHRWQGQGVGGAFKGRDAAHAAGGRYCRHTRFRGACEGRRGAAFLSEIRFHALPFGPGASLRALEGRAADRLRAIAGLLSEEAPENGVYPYRG